MLIKESTKTGIPIIEPNTVSARYVEEQAKEMGLNIPEPISATSWNGGYYRGSNFSRIDGFLIDEVDSVLANIFGKPIDKVTYTPEKTEGLNNMNYGATTTISNLSVGETKNGTSTSINIDTSKKVESNIGLDPGFYITNKKLFCNYDPSLSNTYYLPTSVSSLTVGKGWMSEQIWDINVIVPDKVVEIRFTDGNKEKMVCHKDDTFDLRKCCFIAIAKHLYKKEYTYEGVEYMAEQLMYQKKYVKIVDKALKDYKRKEDEKAKKARMEEEERIIRARQKVKRWKKKQARIERQEAERNETLKAEREEMVSMMAEAINRAKDQRKKSKE